MKVIGIAGSLRARSNTLHYVKTGLKVFEKEGIKSELISLRGKEIKPCNGQRKSVMPIGHIQYNSDCHIS